MVWVFGVASLGNPVGGRFISNAKYCSAPNRNHTITLQVEKGKVKSLQLLTVRRKLRKLVDNWAPLYLPHLERQVRNAECASSTCARDPVFQWYQSCWFYHMGVAALCNNNAKEWLGLQQLIYGGSQKRSLGALWLKANAYVRKTETSYCALR